MCDDQLLCSFIPHRNPKYLSKKKSSKFQNSIKPDSSSLYKKKSSHSPAENSQNLASRKHTNCYFLHCTCVVIFIVFNFIFARTHGRAHAGVHLRACPCVCAFTRNLVENNVNKKKVKILCLRCSFLNEAIINSLTKLQLERTTQRPKTRALLTLTLSTKVEAQFDAQLGAKICKNFIHISPTFAKQSDDFKI